MCGDRTRRTTALAIALLAVGLILSSPSTASVDGSLSLEDRVHAQAAIERIHHSHRIGTTAEFETAIPRSVLEAKVGKFVRQSRALEQQWKTRVTASMIEKELQRMLRETRNADRLWELFAALDDDPVLIRECLVRPILVERLVQNFYAYDRALHAETRLEAEQLREALLAGAAGARLATYEVPKRALNDWLAEFDAAPVPTVTDGQAAMPERGPEGNGAAGWQDTHHSPLPRVEHQAVWTGSEMLVWGDLSAGAEGSRYDPATDTWAAMSTIGAPLPRQWFTAVWTGTEMIVWGGWEAEDPHATNSGGRYDPVSDSWSSVSVAGAPEARFWHSAVWTGSEMIVWGGNSASHGGYLFTGGRYHPPTDTWAGVTPAGAPGARRQHTAVWTGSAMIVWGGYNHTNEFDCFGDGRIYHPAINTWTPVSTVGAPGRRRFHSAVWTGTEMIVWGGRDEDAPQTYGDGARYDPLLNSWTAVAAEDAPSPRTHHTAVWTDTEMIVWGGTYHDDIGDGARYDPGRDSWTPVSLVGAPEGRQEHAAVWTGDRMIVWGGYDPTTFEDRIFNTGGRYSSDTDSWTPTAATSLWDEELEGQTGVWTGNELIVWGGYAWFDSSYSFRNTGSLYNPTTGTRKRIGPVLDPRYDHSAVWTGTEMIVWGGCCWWDERVGWTWFGNGARYDPVADQWLGVGAPPTGYWRRAQHTAVWTGTEMIVWGGRTDNTIWDDGGRYDPDTDSWTLTSTASGVPTGRYNHTAVWTGTEMVVWGGIERYLSGSQPTSTGARYDPVTDTWTTTTLDEAPTPRESHTAVWTGGEMLVWGGIEDGSSGTGARYDASNDLWSPISLVDAPSARQDHSALWTGVGMIVWGGDSSAGQRGDGSTYVPATDSWIALDQTNSPQPRSDHSVALNGREMIVWGGLENSSGDPNPNYVEAAFYLLDDLDGDGFPLADDCDDTDPATHPGAPEVNDGLDNHCPGDLGHGLVDEITGVCGFPVPSNVHWFEWPSQAGATRYEVLRSPGARMDVDCERYETTSTHWLDDQALPGPQVCFHYLVRPLLPNVGSWGADSTGEERDSVCP